MPAVSGGIIGVASDSDKESIMVYNNRQKYDEWDFIAILSQQGPQGRGSQQQNPQNQQNPPNQNQRNQQNEFLRGPAPNFQPRPSGPGTNSSGFSPLQQNQTGKVP